MRQTVCCYDVGTLQHSNTGPTGYISWPGAPPAPVGPAALEISPLKLPTTTVFTLHTGVVCSLLVWGCWLIIMSVYDWLASLGFGGEMLVNSKLCEILPADDQSDNICLPPTPLLQPLD